VKYFIPTINKLECVHAFWRQDRRMLDHVIGLLAICESEHLGVLCHVLISAVGETSGVVGHIQVLLVVGREGVVSHSVYFVV
jgi:hypothetical protein